jgi:hypothetical protein
VGHGFVLGALDQVARALDLLEELVRIGLFAAPALFRRTLIADALSGSSGFERCRCRLCPDYPPRY